MELYIDQLNVILLHTVYMYIACNDYWYIYFLFCVVMKFNSVLCEVIVKITKKMKSQQLQQVYRYLEIYVWCSMVASCTNAQRSNDSS